MTTPTHKGLGFRLVDKETGYELSRIDVQVYSAQWTTTSLPIAEMTLGLISKIGDLYDWSANALYTTYSKSYRMWSQDWRQEVEFSTIDHTKLAQVHSIVFDFALSHRKY